MAKIRVLITDDHMLFRQGIRTLLSAESDIDVVGEAANAADAVAARRLAKTMILSACGSSCWLPDAISFSSPCVLSARLFHCARLAA